MREGAKEGQAGHLLSVKGSVRLAELHAKVNDCWPKLRCYIDLQISDNCIVDHWVIVAHLENVRDIVALDPPMGRKMIYS